ncbi:MAG TPA: pantetheine-phosphate adenylyltransferase [Leptospiraceae bacterium]|nr:pantetheine-phosphate adenylyltransferase [Leptospiraceae bacterium]HMZ59708.1 pantetheine-phosphate adenylyltransferase [Leptospiraceae bacterium]HNF13008.1 pantetheine-phosphate adenylyltransferase [Leptospiraceae bacterium]HNF24871.1 pantetheine-phosphate adenylyltransferase [Leptospiraceae bacterium]HNN06483.1 pantetheine-phosphate adenylyltransferase [Leptospiraceae bacterium]
MRIAVYPGSFDPLTKGHVDIINRALIIFDKIIIGVAVNSKKQGLFSIEERIELIRKVLGSNPNVETASFSGLTADFCKEKGARAIIRGLRAVTDFDYEYAISLMNKSLSPDVETVFFMASGENSYISSSIVKEVAARHGRQVLNHVPEAVNDALMKKYQESKQKG